MDRIHGQVRPDRGIIPVLLEPLEKIDLPLILCSIQGLRADDRDEKRVALELAQLIGRPRESKEGDGRRLTIGQELVFEVERVGEVIAIQGPTGAPRSEPALAGRRSFPRGPARVRHADQEGHRERLRPRELVGHANALGDALFGLLFDEAGVARLREAMIPNGPRPLVILRSGDDTLLLLPWELLRLDGAFLVRDRRIDLVAAPRAKLARRSCPGSRPARSSWW